MAVCSTCLLLSVCDCKLHLGLDYKLRVTFAQTMWILGRVDFPQVLWTGAYHAVNKLLHIEAAKASLNTLYKWICFTNQAIIVNHLYLVNICTVNPVIVVVRLHFVMLSFVSAHFIIFQKFNLLLSCNRVSENSSALKSSFHSLSVAGQSAFETESDWNQWPWTSSPSNP